MTSTPSGRTLLSRSENFLFAYRPWVLLALALFSIFTIWRATHIEFETGFERQLPTDHPFIETFLKFRDQLPGPNRIMVVAEPKDGDVWTQDYLGKLYRLTDDLFFVPGVFRPTVRSVWTPNTRVLEIDEEGIHAHNLIEGTITVEELTPEIIAGVREDAENAGFIGDIISYDSRSAMVNLELLEQDPISGEPISYLEISKQLEEIRDKYEAEGLDIKIIGFAKLVGDVADAIRDVIVFFAISFALTFVTVLFYTRHVLLTLLAVGSSAISVFWQFGLIETIGYGLDPMAILVPFLVYAIGVSHGIQQINLITREVAGGKTAEEAARMTFRELFVPGGIAIITDMIGFLLLMLIPIPMVREIAILAAVGIALKLVANLILLPLIASYLRFSDGFRARHEKLMASRGRFFSRFAVLTRPGVAWGVVVATIVVLGVSAYETRDRQIGELHAGATQLKEDHRYNQDWDYITNNYAVNLDTFVVIMETPKDACIDGRIMAEVDDLTAFLGAQPETVSAISASEVARRLHVMWQEGNLKWKMVPSNQYTLVMTTSPISPSTGLLNRECTVIPVIGFTTDHKAATVNSIIEKTERYIEENPVEGVTFHMASGSVAIVAATNDVIRDAELPMLLLVFTVIALLVFWAHRDWRAVVSCCLPLMLATLMGYWFMIVLEIGLTTATLPVLIMAAGIGVDYALYIFNKLQPEIEAKTPMSAAISKVMQQTGAAVFFTGLVLGSGVLVWAWSSLKFQADMGLLLAFMFIANMAVAITVLPALATLLYRGRVNPES